MITLLYSVFSLIVSSGIGITAYENTQQNLGFGIAGFLIPLGICGMIYTIGLLVHYSDNNYHHGY
jgi:ABC-type transport system involved in cytochrome c biogenesis permease subunit